MVFHNHQYWVQYMLHNFHHIFHKCWSSRWPNILLDRQFYILLHTNRYHHDKRYIHYKRLQHSISMCCHKLHKCQLYHLRMFHMDNQWYKLIRLSKFHLGKSNNKSFLSYQRYFRNRLWNQAHILYNIHHTRLPISNHHHLHKLHIHWDFLLVHNRLNKIGHMHHKCQYHHYSIILMIHHNHLHKQGNLSTSYQHKCYKRTQIHKFHMD